jgi:hypothetical protein
MAQQGRDLQQSGEKKLVCPKFVWLHMMCWFLVSYNLGILILRYHSAALGRVFLTFRRNVAFSSSRFKTPVNETAQRFMETPRNIHKSTQNYFPEFRNQQVHSCEDVKCLVRLVMTTSNLLYDL